MAVTKKRLFGPAALGNSTATKYTVPSLTKTVIRQIHLSNPATSPVTVTISIGADAAGTRLYDAYTIPGAGAGVPFSVLPLNVFWVMDAAEVLAAHSSVTTTVMALFGEEITLG